MARSTRDLLNVIAAIADRGAGFKSLKDAWAVTSKGSPCVLRFPLSSQ
jgi:hypothetical protein